MESVALIIGMIAAMWLARQAAKIDPIEATP